MYLVNQVMLHTSVMLTRSYNKRLKNDTLLSDIFLYLEKNDLNEILEIILGICIHLLQGGIDSTAWRV